MTDLPDVKLRALVNFPVSVTGRTGINVVKINGLWYIDLDVSGFVQNANISADQVDGKFVTVWDSATNSYQNVPYSLVATAGVADIAGHTGALDIGNGLQFTGDTLEILPSSQAEAEAGTDNTTVVTPARARDVVASHAHEINAYWAGVVSTNTAAQNATALNAIIASGVTINIQGQCLIDDEILIQDLNNVKIVGQSDMYSGSSSPSRLIYTGTGPGNAVNMRSTTGCGFDGCDLVNQNGNTGFTGKLLNFDKRVGGTDTDNPFFRNGTISTGSVASSSIIGIALDGITGGSFSRVKLIGKGALIRGLASEAGSTGFSNSVTFRDCNFHPVNNIPVEAPGDNWRFDGGYVQAGSSDGKGRFITGSDTLTFSHLDVLNMGFYDVTAANSEWMAALVGKHLRVDNNIFGCFGITFAVTLRGVQGIVIENNEMIGETGALVNFDTVPVGIAANNYGRIWLNEINNNNLLSNLQDANNDIDIDKNFHAPGGSGVIVVQKPFNGPTSLPTTSKAMWRDHGSSDVIKGVP